MKSHTNYPSFSIPATLFWFVGMPMLSLVGAFLIPYVVPSVSALSLKRAYGGVQQTHQELFTAKIMAHAEAATGVPNWDAMYANVTALSDSIAKVNVMLDGLQTRIATAENGTAGAVKTLNTINTKIATMKDTAGANAKVVGTLQNSSMALEKTLGDNTQKLTKVTASVTTLEQNIKLMGGEGAATAKKIADLQKLMNEVIPGSGTMSTKLDGVEKKLKEFKDKLGKGIDSDVKAYLKTSVDDMRARITAIGEEAREGKIKEIK